MWTRKTKEELVQTRKRQKIADILAAVVLWIFLSCFTAAVPGWGENAKVSTFKDFLQRLPPRMAFWGLVAGCSLWGRFKVRKSGKATAVVCLRCQTVKARQGETVCQCGGELVNLNEMKWLKETQVE